MVIAAHRYKLIHERHCQPETFRIQLAPDEQDEFMEEVGLKSHKSAKRIQLATTAKKLDSSRRSCSVYEWSLSSRDGGRVGKWSINQFGRN